MFFFFFFLALVFDGYLVSKLRSYAPSSSAWRPITWTGSTLVSIDILVFRRTVPSYGDYIQIWIRLVHPLMASELIGAQAAAAFFSASASRP